MSARIIFTSPAADTGRYTIPDEVDYLRIQLVDNYHYVSSGNSYNARYAHDASFPMEGYCLTRGNSIYLPLTKGVSVDENTITATFGEDGTLKFGSCDSKFYAVFNVTGYAYEA